MLILQMAIGIGYSYSHISGFILFLVLGWAFYWTTLPKTIPIDGVDDKPFVSELVHYMFFMAFLLAVVPAIIKGIAILGEKKGLFNKSTATAVVSAIPAAPGVGPQTYSLFGKRR